MVRCGVSTPVHLNSEILTVITSGRIVRTAPNELSFNSAVAWKDIYASRPGHQTFIKSEFYDGGSFASRGVHSIVSERDCHLHGDMRRYLSQAFSDRALGEQEDLICESINRFIELLPTRGDRYDIGKAYEMLTFDIIGDLAFGETFGAIESGMFARKEVRKLDFGIPLTNEQPSHMLGSRLCWEP